MANKNFYVIDQNTGDLFPILLNDNGDGTYSVSIISPSASQQLIKEVRASTAVVTSVDDVASSAQLLAANSARLGFRMFNDSTASLYVKYGATASITDYTVKLDPGGYLEENYYTGRVDGIWSANASGAAKITEL